MAASKLTGTVKGATARWGLDLEFNGKPARVDYEVTLAADGSLSGSVLRNGSPSPIAECVSRSRRNHIAVVVHTPVRTLSADRRTWRGWPKSAETSMTCTCTQRAKSSAMFRDTSGQDRSLLRTGCAAGCSAGVCSGHSSAGYRRHRVGGHALAVRYALLRRRTPAHCHRHSRRFAARHFRRWAASSPRTAPRCMPLPPARCY